MFSSFPSPSRNQIDIGPLPLRFYGLMIALGVIAAVWLARKRYAERGGDPDELSTVCMWAVPGGLIGARIYHVVTDWHTYAHNFGQAFKIWDGGLGIPGGILGGFLVGIAVARYYKMDLAKTMDVVAPAMPLAQSIGRWGNYFNQELYGRPTSLPWGVRIDSQHVLQGPIVNGHVKYIELLGTKPYLVFQPTFLYESIWDLAAAGLLLWIDRKYRLRPSKLFAAYLGLYFLGRAWVESLRSDDAAMLFGVRFNFLLAVVMVVFAIVWLAWGGLMAPEGTDPKTLVPRPGHVSRNVVAGGRKSEVTPAATDPADDSGDDSDTVSATVGAEAATTATTTPATADPGDPDVTGSSGAVE